MTDPRLTDLVDNMDGEGGVGRFMVSRDEVIRVVTAAYNMGHADAVEEHAL